MENGNSDGFVRTGELAAMLGLSTAAVVAMIQEGLIRAIRPRPGGHYRIPREEAERVVLEAEVRGR